MKLNIEREGTVPRYMQVKTFLKRKILADKLRDEVLSGRKLAKEFGISHETARRAIRELVDEGLLYCERGRGTFVAPRGKITRRIKNVAFVLSPKQIPLGLGDPFYSRIFGGIELECRRENYSVFFSTRPEDLLPMGTSGATQSSVRKVDGIIAVHGDLTDRIVRIGLFVPVVLVLDPIKDQKIPTVVATNFQGTYDATTYLLELGHTRIGYINGISTNTVEVENRLNGYLSALSEAGIKEDSRLIQPANYSFDSGHKGTDQLLSMKPRPTAFFCSNDLMAFGALRRIYEAGLSVPRDISVIGFDDYPGSAIMAPALTTVRMPTREIGQAAFRMLTKILDGDMSASDGRIETIPTTLIKRDSCGPPPQDAER